MALFGTALFISAASAGAPASGSPCTKNGQIMKSGGFAYTCTKSGKKLIWSKGVKTSLLPKSASIPTPAPAAPSPTPNVTPQATPSPSPSAVPTPAGTPPTSFEDLDSHLNGIIYGAWLKGSNQIISGTSELGNINILIGPNTKPIDTNPQLAFELASRLYSHFNQSKNVTIVEYGAADAAWAEQQYASLHPRNYSPTYVQNSVPLNGCSGGATGVTDSGSGVILIVEPTDSSCFTFVQRVDAHEFVHTIQDVNINNGSTGNVPPWLLEGNAEWSGEVAWGYNSFSTYKELRDQLIGQFNDDKPLYTPDWISKYLNPNPDFLPINDPQGYWRNNYDPVYAYPIGLMVNEILVNIKGPDAIMNVFLDEQSGLTFQASFEKEFGLSWSDACPIIAKAISDEIQQGITQ